MSGRSILLGGAMAFGLTAVAMAQDKTVAVQFKPGAVSATLKGTIKGDQGINYRFDAAAGQTLHILFKPSNLSCYFNVWEPGAAEAVHIGSISGNEFGKSPTVGGAYRAQVYLMRNAARRNETCRYSLSIELTGAPGGASAGVSDTMMRDICKGEAAPMYGVQPRNVRMTDAVVRSADGGFQIEGTVDKGVEGVKRLRCIFNADRSFNRVMAMTPDGE